MLGAIIGDIVGSRFEWHNHKSKDFEFFHKRCRFTDDSAMTIAVGAALLEAYESEEPVTESLDDLLIYHMQKVGRAYPDAGYGGRFKNWIYADDPKPYQSWGNGSAMRVSPCGEFARSLGEAASLARKAAAVTHDHPEGIRGAEAVATTIFLARGGRSMEELREHIDRYYYPMDFTLDEIRSGYKFDVSCQGSVPQALEAFLESENFEDAIRNAISIGGDSDTIAAIAGSVAESYYGLDQEMSKTALTYLPEDLKEVVQQWYLGV